MRPEARDYTRKLLVGHTGCAGRVEIEKPDYA